LTIIFKSNRPVVQIEIREEKLGKLHQSRDVRSVFGVEWCRLMRRFAKFGRERFAMQLV
jgi:hypothetical protein